MPIEVEKLGVKVNVAALDRRVVSYVELSEAEKRWVRFVFNSGLEHLRKVAPSIAKDIAGQLDLAIKMAGVATHLRPWGKSHATPRLPGTLGNE